MSLALSLVVFLFVSHIIQKLICLRRKFNSLLLIRECLEFSGTNMRTCQTSAIKDRIDLWIWHLALWSRFLTGTEIISLLKSKTRKTSPTKTEAKKPLPDIILLLRVRFPCLQEKGLGPLHCNNVLKSLLS